MLLKNVLNIFDDQISEFIEKIEYLDEDSYEITIYIPDKENETFTGVEILLHDDGSISIWIINEDGVKTTYIPDSVFRIVSSIKNQWSNYHHNRK